MSPETFSVISIPQILKELVRVNFSLNTSNFLLWDCSESKHMQKLLKALLWNLIDVFGNFFIIHRNSRRSLDPKSSFCFVHSMLLIKWIIEEAVPGSVVLLNQILFYLKKCDDKKIANVICFDEVYDSEHKSLAIKFYG